MDDAIFPDQGTVDDEQRRQTFAALDSERYDAIVEQRWDDFEQMCHPGLRYMHATGVVDTRETYLNKLRSGHYDYRTITHDIAHVCVNANTALVWGRMRADLRAGSIDKAIDNQTLTVWVSASSGWLLIAQQPTPADGEGGSQEQA